MSSLDYLLGTKEIELNKNRGNIKNVTFLKEEFEDTIKFIKEKVLIELDR